MSARAHSSSFMSVAALHYEPTSSGLSPSRTSDDESSRVWVDPVRLPNCGDVSEIAGNADAYVKQMTNNTFKCYAVGSEDCFAYNVGQHVKLVEVQVNGSNEKHGRLDATTVAEVVVTKKMLNGAGMMHGGCIAYLIDNCCSTPLVALGLLQGVNGAGVTQSMNIFYHSPAPPGTCLRIVSTTISVGRRVMSSRCEVIDKDTGRVIASGCLSKMQPKL